MPWPHQVRAPASPSMRVRSSPKSRLAQLIRPSQPVRQRTILRKARRFSTWRRAAFGLPLRGQHDVAHAGGAQVVLDALFAVAAIGGDRSRRAPGAPLDPLDRRLEHRRVGRVAGLDVVVDDDAVFVVDELRLVAELDRLAEPALGDRAGIGVVQRHDPGRPVRCRPGEALPGLGGDPAGQRGGPLQRRRPPPGPGPTPGHRGRAACGERCAPRRRPAGRPARRCRPARR